MIFKILVRIPSRGYSHSLPWGDHLFIQPFFLPAPILLPPLLTLPAWHPSCLSIRRAIQLPSFRIAPLLALLPAQPLSRPSIGPFVRASTSLWSILLAYGQGANGLGWWKRVSIAYLDTSGGLTCIVTIRDQKHRFILLHWPCMP